MLPQSFAVLSRDVETAKCYIYGATNNRIYPIDSDTSCYDEEYDESCTYEIENGTYLFHQSSILFHYWNTGYYINHENASLPIYEFDSNILRSNSKTTPINSDSLYHIKRLRLIRQQRNILITDTVIEPTFKLPIHVCEALIDKLIRNADVCVISFKKFDDISDIGITSCYHCYDYNSIMEWLKCSNNCPSCRSVSVGLMRYVRS